MSPVNILLHKSKYVELFINRERISRNKFIRLAIDTNTHSIEKYDDYEITYFCYLNTHCKGMFRI